MEAAEAPAVAAGALGDGGLRARLEDGQDLGGRVRGHLHGRAEAAVQDALVEHHVGVAQVRLLAGGFEGDAVGEERGEDRVDEPVDAALPLVVAVRLWSELVPKHT